MIVRILLSEHALTRFPLGEKEENKPCFYLSHTCVFHMSSCHHNAGALTDLRYYSLRRTELAQLGGPCGMYSLQYLSTRQRRARP